MTVAARLLRDRRRSLAWWSVSMLGVVFVSAAVYPAVKNQPSIDDLLRDLPAGIKAFIGSQGQISFLSPAGYLHGRMFTSLVPILLLIFAIAAGARAIAGAEDDGTLELLLANPVSRRRVAAERYAGVLGLVLALGAATFVSLLVFAPPFGLLKGVSVGRLAAAVLAATSLATLHASIAFGTGAALGGRSRAIAVSAAIGVAGYIAFGLVNSGVATALRFVTPWWWYMSRNILASGLPPEAVVVPLVLSAIVAVIGIAGFEQRDLR